jgi:ribonuclease Z
MKIVFLGTSGSMPTQSRGSSAIAIRREGEIILFDCGEGTQKQMVAARIGFRRRMRIFITHLHGDHVLGLPGLLQTMTLLRRERPLNLYGPRGLRAFVEAFSSVLGLPGFPLKIREHMEGSVVFGGPGYRVEAVEADHDGDCWSYALVEAPRPGRFHPDKARALGVPEGVLWKKLQRGGDVILEDSTLVRSSEVVDPPRRGKKIVYSGDTRPSKALVKLAEGADILLHEATFDDSLAERAIDDGHSTASQAAEVAESANVGRLLLTHISSRYPDPGVLLEQARNIFKNTAVAEDLMKIDIPL